MSSQAQQRMSLGDTEKAFRLVQQLAGEIGIRVAGTEPEKKGVAVLQETFQTMGLETQLQTFPQPVWEETNAILEVIGEECLSVTSPCFGGIGEVVGDVVAVGDPLTPNQVEGLDLKDKIGLVDGRDVVRDYPDHPQTDLLTTCGVKGLIFLAGQGQFGGVPQAYYNFKRWFHGGTPLSLITSYAEGVHLAGKRVRMRVEASVGWSESMNLVAEIRGCERPEETVVVSAHHDTTPTSPGAMDNAGGCGVVVELARIFSQGLAPKRTIRFILFGGHETGLHGSEHWLRTHLSEINQCVAIINFDGIGSPDGDDFALILGSKYWESQIEKAITLAGKPVKTAIGPGGVDMVNFAALGIAAVNFGQHGMQRAHTQLDNIHFVSPQGMETALCCSAALLSALTDGPSSTGYESMQTKTSWDQLAQVRRYCNRWGWGITS